MTDLSKLLDDIQNPETSHVDMIKRRVKGTFQWFLEHDYKTHPIHDRNSLEFFICGQEAFGAIEKDVRKATSSIDLVLYGFDPGMELVRSGAKWPQGTTYGDLLTAKGQGDVKVRMLLWYADFTTNKKAGNVPDFPWVWSPVPWMPSPVNAPKIGWDTKREERLRLRADYCTTWWKAALSGEFKNLEVRLRGAHPLAIMENVAAHLPDSMRTASERAIVEFFGTHHQKPILIDYRAGTIREGQTSTTCGYVMGLNSLTDYWDSDEHRFNDALRELDPNGANWMNAWHRKPYRDYAIRLQGQALHDLNANFVQSWDSADGVGAPFEIGGLMPFKLNNAGRSSEGLEKARLSISPQDIPTPPGARSRAQIVRTQPEKKDATILKAYTLASSNAVNYIYVENQYFQLADWPKMLKRIRQEYRQGMQAAGAKPADIAPLHMFVVIPQAENAGMVPNTYDTLNQLGQGQQMGGYDKLVQGQSKPETILGKDIVRASVAAAPVDPRRDLSALGIKPLVAMLMSYDAGNEAKNILIRARDNDAQLAHAAKEAKDNKAAHVHDGKANDVEANLLSEYNIVPRRYREIYIHSKLMFVDDVYTTLGSANLNVRSMAGDSELNICTEDYVFTAAARRRVWANLAGPQLDGGDCTREETTDTFRKWMDCMRNNALARGKGTEPVGGTFIHPYEDARGDPLIRVM